MAKRCSIFVFFFLIWNYQAYLQENISTYTYRARQIPLQQVIHDLEIITGLPFAYSPERIPLTKKISCKVKTNHLTTFLDEVFERNGIQWENINGQIVDRKSVV